MVNEPTEKELADLAKKLGLNNPNFESESYRTPLFQGDFGYSIDLRFLITVLILFFIGIFLIMYKKKKRK
ncbi:hypothetical protein [Solibacillus sp. CAU 1738]|uniref:hypothetical protein n=1 Tax=Solibacillus sp. CAU 1738 TaxID=3140363 RepID=UPI0032618F66